MFTAVLSLLITGDGNGTVTAKSADGVVVNRIGSVDRTSAGQPIAFPPNDGQVDVWIYEIAPGAKLPPHRHPFPRIGYILSGTLQVKIEATGQTDTFKSGDVIAESIGKWHEGSNPGTVPVRLMVIDMVEKGAGNTELRR